MLPITTVKELFPLWGDYCDNNEATLQREIDRSGEFMLEYIPGLTIDNITEPLALHFMNIVRKRCFDLKRGDREFEHKPEILRDFEYTKEQLELYRQGTLTGPTVENASSAISFTQKPRRFGSWFNEEL